MKLKSHLSLTDLPLLKMHRTGWSAGEVRACMDWRVLVGFPECNFTRRESHSSNIH